MADFFSIKQYTAMTDSELAMKLLKERYLECFICAMFFSSSLTVSIFLIHVIYILSHTFLVYYIVLFC